MLIIANNYIKSIPANTTISSTVVATNPNASFVHAVISANNHESAMSVISQIHGLKYEKDHHILIIDGVAKHISKASTYLLDSLTIN
jgi:hypothetical protein